MFKTNDHHQHRKTNMTTYTGTYSPEDNKLRLYASSRLDKELYTRARELGFIFAPKQDLFVAPSWTPARADFLLELCGEIDDEDTSLVDRAADRADRFSDYQDNRTKDAHAARQGVDAIAQHIPFGQPILVGHHSERRARKDAERIQNGMRKAVQMWDTAEYWKRRAAGALAHAKYKELPAVRARRIKGIEADKRKAERKKADADKYLQLWKREGLTLAQAQQIANYDHISFCFTLAKYPRELPASQYEGSISLWSAMDSNIITAEQAAALAIRAHERQIKFSSRWIAHYENRLAYENAMLEEQGSTAASKFDIVIGGKVKIDSEWFIVTRVNRKDEKIVSVTVATRFCRVRGIEEVTDYQAPTAEEAAKVQAATKLAPMTNYPDEGVINITKEQWEKCQKNYKSTETVKETAKTGRHRVRVMIGAFADPSINDQNKRHSYPTVYITDAKLVNAPMKAPEEHLQTEQSI